MPFFTAVANLVEYHNPNDAVPRIISFVSRKEGWNFGRGKRPSSNTIIKSLLIAKAVRETGIIDTGAFLNDDGSIMVTGYHDKERHVEITCQTNESVRVLMEERGKTTFDEEYVNLEHGRRVLIDRVEQWGNVDLSLVYTISTTLISNWVASKAIAFQNRPAITEYLSSAPTAQLPQVAQYAPVSVATTEPLPAHRQFSGNSAALTFQVIHG
jgi:hypothetical protein